jgi:murein DD-endopeptidase MepM/ murein hydrolase activator NlpD
MIKVEKIYEAFQFDFIPVGKDGASWNGFPDEFSNLKKHGVWYSQNYGARKNYYGPAYGMWGGHNGNDIAGYGVEIYLPVRMYIWDMARTDRGYGIFVRGETAAKDIDGEKVKLEITFGHLASISIEPFKWYPAKTVIGPMGNTGDSTGTHVHLGPRPWIFKDNMWQMAFPDNGCAGYIDMEPMLPFMVYDYSILNRMRNMDKKLVRNKVTGERGYFYGGKLLLAPSKDRRIMMLEAFLMDNLPDRKVDVSDEEWKLLPKADF